MYKDRVNFKLVNLALLVLIIFLMYQTGFLWMGLFDKIVGIMGPFVLAFAIAYALHPILRYLRNKGIPKSVSIFIILAVIIGVFLISFGLIIPMLASQSVSLFNNLLAFIKEISTNTNFDFGPLQSSLSDYGDTLVQGVGSYLSNGIMGFVSTSMSVITIGAISFSAMVYFLIDMESIRRTVKDYLKRKNKKHYRYVKLLDHEMKQYCEGFIKIVFIAFFEYTIAFTLIGHPNALLLGFLAALANLIPYFGGIITNCIACLTAFVISPALFIKTVISFFVLSNLDGYVINPLVYGKTNQIHPIVVILAVFAGGILFGIIGIVISLPVAIIIQTTIKFYKDDILDKIVEIKESDTKVKTK